MTHQRRPGLHALREPVVDGLDGGPREGHVSGLAALGATNSPHGTLSAPVQLGGALVRTAFLLTADRGHAEDLAQATLLAWDRLHDAALHAGFGGRLQRDRAPS